jgi:hypothetical protein
VSAIYCSALAGPENHTRPKRRDAGSTMGIFDRQQARGNALDDFLHCKLDDQ